MGKQALLVLGAGYDQVFMIKTARSMGVLTVAVDANEAAPGLKLADYAEAIDFTKVDQVISYCHGLIDQGVSLCGVSTMGSDIPHLLAKIAAHFEWNGPSLQTGEWASHKFKMKQRFSEKGIPVPVYAQVNDAKEVYEVWQTWDCSKVIIKPTDRAGSRGVQLIVDESDIESAFAYAKSYALNGQVMIEEFVEGLQISTESILAGAISFTPGFADRAYESMESFWPNIMENGGWLPTRINEAEKASVCSLVEEAARALGIDYGVAKGDVVICPIRGPMIIEMAARLSGGDFSESLVPLATGVNYVATVIQIALSRHPDFNALKPSKSNAVANRYLFPPSGKLEAIEGLDVVRRLPQCVKLELYKKVGDQLEAIRSHGCRAGVFVLVSDTREELESLIAYVYDTVRFKVDGVWVSLKPRDC